MKHDRLTAFLKRLDTMTDGDVYLTICAVGPIVALGILFVLVATCH